MSGTAVVASVVAAYSPAPRPAAPAPSGSGGRLSYVARTSTIRVTGDAGFSGSALVRQLVRDTDHTVVNVDALTYTGNLDSLRTARRTTGRTNPPRSSSR